MVLEAAINEQVDRLVTFNQRDFALAGGRFGLVISAPRTARGDVAEALRRARGGL